MFGKTPNKRSHEIGRQTMLIVIKNHDKLIQVIMWYGRVLSTLPYLLFILHRYVEVTLFSQLRN